MYISMKTTLYITDLFYRVSKLHKLWISKKQFSLRFLQISVIYQKKYFKVNELEAQMKIAKLLLKMCLFRSSKSLYKRLFERVCVKVWAKCWTLSVDFTWIFLLIVVVVITLPVYVFMYFYLIYCMHFYLIYIFIL